MNSSLPDECESILISSEQIQSRVDELARDISDHYKTLLAEGETLALVPILSGSYIFAADLSRKLTVPNTVDFMALSSYRGSTSSSGEVKILMDTRDSVYGRHLLVLLSMETNKISDY
jgi:hypoxanthine phosphoribosyltransferase